MAKIADMSGDERETHISITAADRGAGGNWEIYTDDPVMIGRFDKMKLVCVRTTAGGGRIYSVPQNQITVRKKRVTTAEQKRARQEHAERMREMALARMEARRKEGKGGE